MSLFLAEKGEGFTVSRKLEKLGYKGIDSAELVFEDYFVPEDRLIGGEEGRGLQHALGGLELGRINIAARGVGVAQASLDEAVRYAQVRKSFGKPICEHQAIQIKLADMATQVESARLLIERAAAAFDRGERCDMEAGMAKLAGSEAAIFCSLESMRVHGGYGYSKEFNVERFYGTRRCSPSGRARTSSSASSSPASSSPATRSDRRAARGGSGQGRAGHATVLPLAGLRVLAVEQYGAGPFGTTYLADLGAEVIKIENPREEGELGRRVGPFFLGPGDSHFYQCFNRNKRSLKLDLKSPGPGRRFFEISPRAARRCSGTFEATSRKPSASPTGTSGTGTRPSSASTSPPTGAPGSEGRGRGSTSSCRRRRATSNSPERPTARRSATGSRWLTT